MTDEEYFEQGFDDAFAGHARKEPRDFWNAPTWTAYCKGYWAGHWARFELLWVEAHEEDARRTEEDV